MCGGGSVLPVSKIFLDPDRYGHWRFLIKYISVYWDQSLRNGYGMMVVVWLQESEENMLFPKVMLSQSPWNRSRE